jgi:PAS domain S-box-containing protein
MFEMLSQGTLNLQEAMASLWNIDNLGVCLIDEAGYILRISDTAAHIFNAEPELLTGHIFTELFPEHEVKDLLRAHRAYLDNSETHPFIYATSNIETSLIKGFISPHKRCVLAIFKEKQHEENIFEDYWSRIALKTLGEAIIITDREGRIQYMNEWAEHLTKVSRADSVGKDIDRILILLDSETEYASTIPLERVLQGAQFTSNRAHIILDHQGQKIAISEFISPWYDALGTIKGMVVAFREYRKSTQTPMRGTIEDFEDATTLLQTLSAVKRNGLLTLSQGMSDYKFYFQAGRLVHMEHQEFNDDAALIQVSKLKEGIFTFDPAVQPDKQSMNTDIASLIIDAARRLDEVKKTRIDNQERASKDQQGLIVLPNVPIALYYIAGLGNKVMSVKNVQKNKDGSQRIVLEGQQIRIVIERGRIEELPKEIVGMFKVA